MAALPAVPEFRGASCFKNRLTHLGVTNHVYNVEIVFLLIWLYLRKVRLHRHRLLQSQAALPLNKRLSPRKAALPLNKRLSPRKAALPLNKRLSPRKAACPLQSHDPQPLHKQRFDATMFWIRQQRLTSKHGPIPSLSSHHPPTILPQLMSWQTMMLRAQRTHSQTPPAAALNHPRIQWMLTWAAQTTKTDLPTR